jgi:hypothetical protein
MRISYLTPEKVQILFYRYLFQVFLSYLTLPLVLRGNTVRGGLAWRGKGKRDWVSLPFFQELREDFFFSSEKQKIGEGICCNYVLHLSSFYARI